MPSAATLRTALVLLLALLSLRFTKLALPAGLFVFLSFLAAPVSPAALRRKHRSALGVAAVAACISVPIFLIREAVPGLVQGGTTATDLRAVSRLREIVFAEDAARKEASWDPDRDGVGSALLVGELTGELGMRQGPHLVPALLERYPKVEATRAGSALEIGGFWFAVCLPTRGGGFASEPDSSFDDEASERRFVAYAWPSGRGPGLQLAYFIDEHERILTAPSSELLRFGREHPPSCDDALAPATASAWQVWRKKKPRATLPGETNENH
jgi:hypothetical protein